MQKSQCEKITALSAIRRTVHRECEVFLIIDYQLFTSITGVPIRSSINWIIVPALLIIHDLQISTVTILIFRDLCEKNIFLNANYLSQYGIYNVVRCCVMGTCVTTSMVYLVGPALAYLSVFSTSYFIQYAYNTCLLCIITCTFQHMNLIYAKQYNSACDIIPTFVLHIQQSPQSGHSCQKYRCTRNTNVHEHSNW